MKIFRSLRRREKGSLLMMTIMVTAIIGFVLASYLTLVSNQNRSIQRSLTWNSAMPLIEAGIEEAMAHLNQNTNLFYSDGWQEIFGMAVKRRFLDDGRFVVSISFLTQPMVECTAYIPAPASLVDEGGYWEPGSVTEVPIYRRRGELYRSVRVLVGGGALFAKGMVARENIDLHGNNIATDSFDSADINFSTGGQYNPAKHKDNGDVATNSREPDIFNAGNANIMGKVATGPGGNIAMGPGGTVGSMKWVTDGNLGIEGGHFTDDMNLSFPKIEVPDESGAYTPSTGSINVTNFIMGSNLVTATALPSPLPEGTIATNYGLVTANAYPTGPIVGTVITNFVRTISTDYPLDPYGPVYTNSITIFTNHLPATLPGVPIITNQTLITNSTLPNPLPNPPIISNTVFASVQYPYSPMPAGPPAAPPLWQPPAPGTYVGVLTNRYEDTGPRAGRGWWHDYRAVSSFTYYSPIYAYTIPISFAYTNLTYTYNAPESYTFMAATTTNITITQVKYDYVLDKGTYQMSILSGTMYVRGDATLVVTDSINLSGLDKIVIGPTGCLKIYMYGATAKIAGKGIVNETGLARNFTYYGMESNTTLEMTGNGLFIGSIYAPDTDLVLSGGGNNILDFIGASVSRTATMNGHFNFHYDEDLGRRGPRSRFTITCWNEIAPDDTRINTILKPWYDNLDRYHTASPSGSTM